MTIPPGTYGACFVPEQTGYPPASQPPNRATQAVLAYQAFQQSVAEQPQYIRFVGTPEDIALLRQELERGGRSDLYSSCKAELWDLW
jgi:hypothetical protein